MTDENVKVVLNVPKKRHDLISRIAALEGSTVEQWCLYFIDEQLSAIEANDFELPLDLQKMKVLYQ